MATVNVNKQPLFLTAGENPIIVELGTDPSGTTEQFAITTITIGANITSTDYIEFVFGYPKFQIVRFNASNSPTAPTDFLTSGYTFLFTPVTFTQTEIAASLVEALRSSVVFSTNYTSWHDSNVVYIKSRIANQRLTLATSTIVPNGNNLIQASSLTKFTVNVVQTGQAKWVGDLQSKYSLWVDLYVDDNNRTTFSDDSTITGSTFITTLKKPWQYGNNEVDFDLGQTLKAYCEPPAPKYGTGYEGVYRNYVRNYLFQYGDYETIEFESIVPLVLGFPNVLKTLRGTVVNKWVTPASLPYQNTNSLLNYYSGGTGLSALPLTNSPDYKPVYINQKAEYIYFLNSYFRFSGSLTYTLSLTVEYRFIDGTSSTSTNVITLPLAGYSSTNKPDGLWRVNVAPSQVGIDSLGYFSSKQVESYVVKTVVGGQRLVEEKIYSIDEVQPKTGVEFMWLNEFGVHDNQYFAGNITTGVDRSVNDMIKNVPYDFPEGFEYNSQYNTQVTDVFTVASSFVQEDVFNWLKSILKSNKVYILENDKYQFVKITEFQYEKNTIENRYSVQLTVRRTIAENNVDI